MIWNLTSYDFRPSNSILSRIILIVGVVLIVPHACASKCCFFSRTYVLFILRFVCEAMYMYTYMTEFP